MADATVSDSVFNATGLISTTGASASSSVTWRTVTATASVSSDVTTGGEMSPTLFTATAELSTQTTSRVIPDRIPYKTLAGRAVAGISIVGYELCNYGLIRWTGAVLTIM